MIKLEAARNEKYYTYEDYCTWDDSERWELIDGVAYAMSPGASFNHQSVGMALAWQLMNYLHGKPCKVLTAPFDVRLTADRGDDTVVQPDVLVVCDKTKFDPAGRGVIGAPELVVEILSPSTQRHDKLTKLTAYQKAGVLEYWIVDPESKTVSVNILDAGGKYETRLYYENDIVKVHVLDDCTIELAGIFADLL